jgi:6-phosphogluconate dehydrogenase
MDVAIMGECPWVIPAVIVCGGGNVDFQPSYAWVKMEATKFEVPIPTLNAALDARYFSTMKDERVQASKILKAPELVDTPSVLKEQICDDLQNAIYCTSLCAYAEGLSLLQAASEVESWDVNIETCVELWNRPGSFLASNLLKTIDSALASSIEQSSNLLVVPDIAAELDALHMSWRRAVTLSLACGSPVPCLSAALTYYDSYRSHTSPVGIIRAQRDFFGGYGYDRFDREGWFTTNWTREHTEWAKKEMKGTEEAGDGKRKRRRNSKPVEAAAGPAVGQASEFL